MQGRGRQLTVWLLCTALMVTLFATGVFAAATGQIKGTIVDQKTGQPLIGATVLVLGTNRGANTDVDGKYQIRQVEAGTYTLKITQIGYQEIEVTNVNVKSDLTVEINQKMAEKTEQLKDKVVVEAEID
ncbi:MAG TPA: carboxypeptidase-like regulatory domain-containing protein, partial [candidate division Zixibacteria bacterium]|nr:carboxypeptidase-like regulatory domain-containing protein [candidate division Zixibacteria bacterium]